MTAERSEGFLDPRGARRAMRVTYHPVADTIVFSLWHGERCVGSFRMPSSDARRLIGLLAHALAERPSEPTYDGRPQPTPGTPAQDHL